MRISKVQKHTLFYLYAIELQQGQRPIPSMDLYKLVNKAFNYEVADRNFRPSCHKLKESGLINLFRNPSLKIAWQLTDAGREKAKQIYQELTAKAV
jgi:hypothetical protein